MSHTPPFAVALVGMAGRFPGARDVGRFWDNLCAGVESVRPFTDSELLAAGVPAAMLHDPHYVKAAPVLDDIDQFDAAFFRFSPREAALMDPQHRLFLECAWEALEDAGCDPSRFEGAIGVYAGQGANVSSYLFAHADAYRGCLGANGSVPHLGNDKDFLSTRVSFKLDLRGPSLTVQTACSTSLVAVHLACQGLLAGECDLALAGGVCVRVPHRVGYLHEEGNVMSPDGHCRAFDARAAGTVYGSGVGVVVLKPLDKALRDGDRVYALIRGSAVNNDGGDKVSYTASAVEQQARLAAEVLALADVPPATVGYVEAHGSATYLGDPIEIQALGRAFNRSGPLPPRSCAIGSVKTNVGHLEAAAGVTGLIKTALALYHRRLPASLNFQTPNPRIDFASTPFYVQDRLTDWSAGAAPRRACVNSLGIGGTNAHVVLEEAPEPEPREAAAAPPGPHVLTLSARTAPALHELAGRYADWLGRNLDADLADVCFTTAIGRSHFAHRAAVVASSAEEMQAALAELAAGRPSPAVRQGVVQPGQVSQPDDPGQAAQPDLPAAELLADQYVRGQAPDFTAWDGRMGRRKVSLPTYPFQRQRYWVESPPSAPVLDAGSLKGGEPLRANLTLLGPDGTVVGEVRGLAVKRVVPANGDGRGGQYQVEWRAEPPQPQVCPTNSSPVPSAAGPAVAGLAGRLRQALPERRVRLLVDHLQAEVRKVLGLPDVPDPRRGFMELGMDSLLAVNLCNGLQEQLDGACTLNATALFDHPNIAALAAHLARQFDPTEAAPETIPELDAEVSAADREELSRLSEAERLDLLRSELTDLLERA